MTDGTVRSERKQNNNKGAFNANPQNSLFICSPPYTMKSIIYLLILTLAVACAFECVRNKPVIEVAPGSTNCFNIFDYMTNISAPLFGTRLTGTVPCTESIELSTENGTITWVTRATGCSGKNTLHFAACDQVKCTACTIRTKVTA